MGHEGGRASAKATRCGKARLAPFRSAGARSCVQSALGMHCLAAITAKHCCSVFGAAAELFLGQPRLGDYFSPRRGSAPTLSHLFLEFLYRAQLTRNYGTAGKSVQGPRTRFVSAVRA